MTAVNPAPAPQAFTLTTIKDVPRADSRLLARQMGKKHPSLFELVKDHRAGYQRIKAAMVALSSVTLLGVSA